MTLLKIYFILQLKIKIKILFIIINEIKYK